MNETKALKASDTLLGISRQRAPESTLFPKEVSVEQNPLRLQLNKTLTQSDSLQLTEDNGQVAPEKAF